MLGLVMDLVVGLMLGLAMALVDGHAFVIMAMARLWDSWILSTGPEMVKDLARIPLALTVVEHCVFPGILSICCKQSAAIRHWYGAKLPMHLHLGGRGLSSLGPRGRPGKPRP